MFKRIRLRIQDMKTISKLIAGADEQAHMSGEDEPGAEHFLLSALRLPDGTAKRVFERIGANPEQFRNAIKKQYSDALSSIGIDQKVLDEDPEPVKSSRRLHNAKPSGRTLMKELYALKQKDKDRPLLGAHVISVIATMKHGVAARSLRTMNINDDKLSLAVKNELDSYCY